MRSSVYPSKPISAQVSNPPYQIQINTKQEQGTQSNIRNEQKSQYEKMLEFTISLIEKEKKQQSENLKKCMDYEKEKWNIKEKLEIIEMQLFSNKPHYTKYNEIQQLKKSKLQVRSYYNNNPHNSNKSHNQPIQMSKLAKFSEDYQQSFNMKQNLLKQQLQIEQLLISSKSNFSATEKRINNFTKEIEQIKYQLQISDVQSQEGIKTCEMQERQDILQPKDYLQEKSLLQGTILQQTNERINQSTNKENLQNKSPPQNKINQSSLQNKQQQQTFQILLNEGATISVSQKTQKIQQPKDYLQEQSLKKVDTIQETKVQINQQTNNVNKLKQLHNEKEKQSQFHQTNSKKDSTPVQSNKAHIPQNMQEQQYKKAQQDKNAAQNKNTVLNKKASQEKNTAQNKKLPQIQTPKNKKSSQSKRISQNTNFLEQNLQKSLNLSEVNNKDYPFSTSSQISQHNKIEVNQRDLEKQNKNQIIHDQNQLQEEINQIIKHPKLQKVEEASPFKKIKNEEIHVSYNLQKNDVQIKKSFVSVVTPNSTYIKNQEEINNFQPNQYSVSVVKYKNPYVKNQEQINSYKPNQQEQEKVQKPDQNIFHSKFQNIEEGSPFKKIMNEEIHESNNLQKNNVQIQKSSIQVVTNNGSCLKNQQEINNCQPNQYSVSVVKYKNPYVKNQEQINSYKPNQQEQEKVQKPDQNIFHSKFQNIEEGSSFKKITNEEIHDSYNLQKNNVQIQKNSVSVVTSNSSYVKNQEQTNSLKPNQQEKGLIPDQNIFLIKQVQHPYQIPENTSLASVKVGLPNNKLVCYLNSSLQALRQIYFYDKYFFTNSQFGNCLYKLFKKMEDYQQVDQDMLQEIFRVSNEYETHLTNGGDSYLALHGMLQRLWSQMKNDPMKCRLFDELFTTKLEHQLYCSKCNRALENTDNIFAYHYEEHFSFEHKQLNLVFPPVSFMLCEEIIQCPFPQCGKKNLPSSKILYKSAPKFVFVKVAPPTHNSNSDFQFFKNKIRLHVEGQSETYYNLIGFCNYYSMHYTYTGKYEKQWIEFNDTYIKIHDQPSAKNAIYFLLQRID